MSRILGKTDGGPQGRGYRDGVVFIPRTWINTYEWRHAYEGSRGDMLVHFPGLEEARSQHMADWLDVVERTPEKWECPLEDTIYGNATSHFWQEYSSAFDDMVDAERLRGTTGTLTESADTAYRNLKDALELEADDVEKIRQTRLQWHRQRSTKHVD